MTSLNADASSTIDSSEIWQMPRCLELCRRADNELEVLIALHRGSPRLSDRVTVEAARLVPNFRRGGAAGDFV
jgi:hypothetical protein